MGADLRYDDFIGRSANSNSPFAAPRPALARADDALLKHPAEFRRAAPQLRE